MNEISIIRCPAAMPCATCGKVVIPGEVHRCKKVRLECLIHKHARRAGMTDVDATGSWGQAVRVLEERG